MKLAMPREGSVAYSQKEEVVRERFGVSPQVRAQNAAFQKMLAELVSEPTAATLKRDAVSYMCTLLVAHEDDSRKARGRQ